MRRFRFRYERSTGGRADPTPPHPGLTPGPSPSCRRGEKIYTYPPAEKDFTTETQRTRRNTEEKIEWNHEPHEKREQRK
jgi:hypothetical protein